MIHVFDAESGTVCIESVVVIEHLKQRAQVLVRVARVDRTQLRRDVLPADAMHTEGLRAGTGSDAHAGRQWLARALRGGVERNDLAGQGEARCTLDRGRCRGGTWRRG